MAKIAVISDTHFGFAFGTERENDCYDAAQEAFEKAKDADIILLPGDIFDSRVPKPEAWGRAMRILEKPHLEQYRGVSLDKTYGKVHVSPTALKGIPVVAIHGTHDRRGKHLLNPVQGLEAGFLVHLHLSTIVLDVRGERIAIHGMGGVPESYAKEVLDKWDPKPEKGAYNIFVLQQSIEPFIYSPLEPPSLKLEDMPEGFDLYVCGHVHASVKTEVHGKPFIIPGSTITTQANKAESKKPKGFFLVSTKEKIEFVEISSRKVFHEDIEFKGDSKEDARKKISDALEKITALKLEKKPIVRVRLEGYLQKGVLARDIDARSLIENLPIIATIGDSTRHKDDKRVERKKESVEETGMKILHDECRKRMLSLDERELFDALLDDDPEEAVKNLHIKTKSIPSS